MKYLITILCALTLFILIGTFIDSNKIETLQKEIGRLETSCHSITWTTNVYIVHQYPPTIIRSYDNPMYDKEGYKQFLTNVFAGKYDNKNKQ